MFGDAGGGEFYGASTSNLVYCDYVMLYQKDTAKYHVRNGDSVSLHDVVFNILHGITHGDGVSMRTRYSKVCKFIWTHSGKEWVWGKGLVPPSDVKRGG